MGQRVVSWHHAKHNNDSDDFMSQPPVRPVRETFASYGSRQRDIMGKVHFASSTVPSPWTALRVRWVPVYCCPTLSLRAFAMSAAFPRSDYYAQFDCLQGLGGFGSGLPYLLPPSFTSLTRLSRVHNRGLKQDGLGGVLLSVPSALCGSPVLCRVKQVDLHQPFVRATDATHRPLLSIDFGGLADIAGKVCQGLGFPKDYARFL
jgi:hypothetical protein